MNRPSEIPKCPGCGREIPTGGYALRDAQVCMECVHDLRFAYPIVYIPNPHPWEERRPDLGGLFENEGLSNREKADMIEELRELPLNRADPNPKSYYTVDRMRRLTGAEFADRLARAEAIRIGLLRRYDDYDNVCTVAAVCPMQKLRATEGVQRMWQFRGTVGAAGTVRLGKFRSGDVVTVLRNGSKLLDAEVLAAFYLKGCASDSISPKVLGGENGMVAEGYQAQLILSQEAAWIQPGDLIVMDD